MVIGVGGFDGGDWEIWGEYLIFQCSVGFDL